MDIEYVTVVSDMDNSAEEPGEVAIATFGIGKGWKTLAVANENAEVKSYTADNLSTGNSKTKSSIERSGEKWARNPKRESAG